MKFQPGHWGKEGLETWSVQSNGIKRQISKNEHLEEAALPADQLYRSSPFLSYHLHLCRFTSAALMANVRNNLQ